jgi:hypothetical protein
MKKLLLVLLVVTLASFLFVGCLPTTPTEGEGEGEGEVEICPTVSITSQVAVDGKNYIKAGSQTITVTFAVPTEPVSVYVGAHLRKPAPLDDMEVVMYPNADKTVYTGDFKFGDYWPDCGEAYIYVETCDTCEACKYPYIVDGIPPWAEIEICIDDCDCAGCTLSFTSTSETDCDVTEEYCGDDCSGLASWSVNIYDEYPFDECCDVPCVEPIDSGSGTECPVSWTTECIEFDKLEYEDIFVVVTLVDNVGNDVKYGAWVHPCDYDTCDEVEFAYWDGDDCVDNSSGVFSICEDHECVQQP